MSFTARPVSPVQQLFRCVALLLVVVPLACAQPEGDGDDAERLPDRVRGTWVPISDNYLRFGDLVIDADSLTWSTCVKEPYRVVLSKDSAWLIELVRSPACPFPGRPTGPWWLEISNNGQAVDLVLSRCEDTTEIDKPRRERTSCAYGSLSKRSN
jgi:hypothetical protein